MKKLRMFSFPEMSCLWVFRAPGVLDPRVPGVCSMLPEQTEYRGIGPRVSGPLDKGLWMVRVPGPFTPGARGWPAANGWIRGRGIYTLLLPPSNPNLPQASSSIARPQKSWSLHP